MSWIHSRWRTRITNPTTILTSPNSLSHELPPAIDLRWIPEGSGNGVRIMNKLEEPVRRVEAQPGCAAQEIQQVLFAQQVTPGQHRDPLSVQHASRQACEVRRYSLHGDAIAAFFPAHDEQPDPNTRSTLIRSEVPTTVIRGRLPIQGPVMVPIECAIHHPVIPAPRTKHAWGSSTLPP